MKGSGELNFVATSRRPLDLPVADALLATLATAFGAVSLWYPLGRDQGLFYYAAREWLLRGQLLYRDVWDHKPPVIYFVHMLALAVFGEHQWAIRVVELFVAVPLLAWLTARLAHRHGAPLPRGALGAAWLAVALFYYGYHSFWNTAQCEIWVAVFAAAALVAALHGRGGLRGAAVAGVLCALALFSKPVAVFFVLVCAGVVVRRAWASGSRRTALALPLLAWATGGGVTGGAILAYFAARKALGPMLDILVGANSAYVDQERAIHDVAGLYFYTAYTFAWYHPFSTLFVVVTAGAVLAVCAGRGAGLGRRYLLPAVLAAASSAAVLAQLKFYPYHWGTLALAVGVFAATLYGDISAFAPRRGGAWLAPVVFVTAAAGLYSVSTGPAGEWSRAAGRTWRFATAQITSDEFASTFDIPKFFSNQDSVRAGRYLREYARPGDTLVVRGFEPQVYAWSGLHYSGRFFWTAFLTMPTRVYRRDEWLREDREALLAAQPRWVVTLTPAARGLDSSAAFAHFGYVKRLVLKHLTVMELGTTARAR